MKKRLIEKIKKAIRANTKREFKETGQFGEGENVYLIRDVDELTNDIINIIEEEIK